MATFHAQSNGASTPFWTLPRIPKDHGPLNTDAEIDVCVIGAGISGLSAAYQCLLDGRKVMVVDKGAVASGETLRTSAHLASALDDRFTTLERRHGAKGARLLAQSHAAAIDWIEDLCTAHGIDCDFQRIPGFLYAAASDDADFLQKEAEAATRAGLVAEVVNVPFFGCGANTQALRFENQASFDIGRYIAGLSELILRQGGRIHPETMAVEVKPGKTAKVLLQGGHTILAHHIVVATDIPIASAVTLPLRQAAYRSYVLAFSVPAGQISTGLHWDNEDPYHYVRLARSEDPGRQVLLVGGEDHKTGQDSENLLCFERLEQWAREHFPMAAEVAFRWSGQILEPFDGVGFVGPMPHMGENIYVITGDSGNGLTLGTLGGKIVADAIVGRAHEWGKVYAPDRSLMPALGDFLQENANVAGQYFDHFRPGDVASEADIAPEQGALVREGLSMLAVYRDADGSCHKRSAICPHLGGIVHWNDAEKTWDCPCHGSRFDAHGKVLSGPSTSDLAAVNEAASSGG